MQRVCFRLQLKPERLDEYVERHERVWPDMLDALVETGWNNYSLFLDRSDGTLIGYFETPDLAAALQGMASRRVNARWQAEMAGFFQDIDGRPPDEGIVPLEQVFRLPPTGSSALA
jgi:L-rhamnose mutarotase